ncbi:hypothetical protein [Halorientalis pallida]|uniref:Uncharacterized protein n=1 Tax=Halorientalis pallida TaxID=2479928 RepID=A0A498KSC3_9EURY|nr:hypothetical protein [Halorientalis pallida]RXK46696.1 hypothetical protein EAF64_18665 [Halorientalis pallida]
MRDRRRERLLDDERGTATLAVGGGSVFPVLVGLVLGGPMLAALVGAAVRRERAFDYVATAGAALIAVFALTGTTGFTTHWTVIGIVAVLSVLAGHWLSFREDRASLVIVGCIYAAPVALAVALLLTL